MAERAADPLPDPPGGALWPCPRCGREFANRNQSHFCGRHELAPHFAGKSELARLLFEDFVRLVNAIGPAAIVPEKSRIAFQVRMSFAALMVRRTWLVGHLVLARRLDHPRFSRIDTISARNHVHHFRLARREDLDPLFASWLREAYTVGEQRHLSPGSRGAPGRRRG